MPITVSLSAVTPPPDATFSATGTTAYNTIVNRTASVTGSVALNEISAATGAVTIDSANNTGIVCQWANTVNSTICFTINESAASTGGTSTTGVPNQVLFKLDTFSGSTQSPFSLWVQGGHVASASPSSQQLLFRSGTPAIPPIAATSATTTGFAMLSTGPAIAIAAVENSRFAAGVFQCSFATAVATSYSLNFRKSRGTVLAPTVITTGDDLATISGFGYRGATNTYGEACRITFDSTGTIADTTSGIGGIIRFSTTLAGTDTSVQEGMQLVGGSIPAFQPPTTGLTTLGSAGIGWKQLWLDYTNTATVGNVTINKASGRVNLAAAGTTLTLTNSMITAASHVFLNADGAPGNVVAVQLYAVPAAGSCTINAVPAVTNQTAIDFCIINAD